MTDDAGCRLQVCGPLLVCIRGVDVSAHLPGGQARALLTFLVVHRHRALSRTELVDALWPVDPPPAVDRDLSALLSRLRSVLGSDIVPARGDVGMSLPDPAHIDLEVATSQVDHAERALALADWSSAWAAGHVAQAIARRGFLPDARLPWAERERGRLREVLLRAYEAIGESGLHLGGPAVTTARRLAEEVIAEEPLREGGYRLAMRACVARGNPAEALLVYDRLRRVLSDELGVDPGPESRALFNAVLAESSANRLV